MQSFRNILCHQPIPSGIHRFKPCTWGRCVQSPLPTEGRPMSWAATWLHTWPLEKNKAHDWIITNNTRDLMPWKHFSRHGTRPRDTRTGNSASGECTVSWHQLISWSVHVYAHQLTQGPWSWGIPLSIYARLRGLIFEFKNARDLNDVKNQHLRLFLDQIGCDRSNDNYSTFCRRPISPLSRGFTMFSPSASPTSEPAFFLAMSSN